MKNDPLGDYPLGAQHYARSLPGGVIAAHDNGSALNRPPRGVAYRITARHGPQRLSTPRPIPRLSAHSAAALPRCSPGRMLIDWGGAVPTQITEFDPQHRRTSASPSPSTASAPTSPARVSPQGTLTTVSPGSAVAVSALAPPSPRSPPAPSTRLRESRPSWPNNRSKPALPISVSSPPPPVSVSRPPPPRSRLAIALAFPVIRSPPEPPTTFSTEAGTVSPSPGEPVVGDRVQRHRERTCARAVVDDIHAGLTEHAVRPVGPRTLLEGVVTGTAALVVAVRAARDRVVAAERADRVNARAGVDHVGLRRTDDDIATRGARDRSPRADDRGIESVAPGEQPLQPERARGATVAVDRDPVRRARDHVQRDLRRSAADLTSAPPGWCRYRRRFPGQARPRRFRAA